MAFKVYRITRYQSKFDANAGGPGGVGLYDSEKLRVTVLFVSDTTAVPRPVLMADLESATAYFRMSSFQSLIDMLRNEDPVSVTLNDQPPGFVFVHTGLEPAGVADEAAWVGSGYMP
jgi:hypothetical protein